MTQPPYLVAAANKLGVAIDSIQGTGPDGRLTINDVRNAARSASGGGAGTAQPRNAIARRPAAVLRPMTDPWGSSNGRPVLVDIYDPNPYVTYVLQTSGAPKLGDLATAQPGYEWTGGGTPPTFFVSGTLPPLTASGVDPAVLAQIPWQFRHTAALTPYAPHVLQLLEVGVDFDSDEPGLNTEPGGSALEDYRRRVWSWAVPRQVPAELTAEEYVGLFPDEGDTSEPLVPGIGRARRQESGTAS